MQKILFYLLILVPSLAFATSGACSGHGGVDCSAGRDYDGSVICNDGWTNSSVSYSSMVMCDSYDDIGVSVIAEMQKYCVEKHGGNSFYYSREFMCECIVGYAKNSATSDQCVSEQQAFQAYCLQKHGSYSSYNNKNNTCECVPAYSKSPATNGQCRPNEETQLASCYDSIGYNSYRKDDKCYCSDGFLLDSKTNKCTPGTNEMCKGFGNAHYDRQENSCLCNLGYYYNSSDKTCALEKAVIPVSTPPVTKVSPDPVVKKVETPKPKVEVKKEVKVGPKVEIVATTSLSVTTKTPAVKVEPVKERWFKRLFRSWFN